MINSGISKLKFRPQDIRKDMEKESKRFISAVMRDVEEVAQDVTPVDTGQARRGWRNTNKGVLNNVDHITHLEDGWSKQAPTGIGRPVIKEINRRYIKGKYDAE